MTLQKLREVKYHAGYYKIKIAYKRSGDFDYTVKFYDGMEFTDGHKAMLFIDRLVEDNNLTPYTKPYRVGFGWEIY